MVGAHVFVMLLGGTSDSGVFLSHDGSPHFVCCGYIRLKPVCDAVCSVRISPSISCDVFNLLPVVCDAGARLNEVSQRTLQSHCSGLS